MDLGNYSIDDAAIIDRPFLLFQEFHQLVSIHHSSSPIRVLITGAAGCGKTRLLYTFFNHIDHTSKIYWLNKLFWKEELERIKSTESDSNKISLIFDGIEEFQNSAEIFSSVKPFDTVYFTSRTNDWDFSFTHVISIQCLSTEKCKLLLNYYLADINLATEITNSLKDILTNLSARDILHITNQFLIEHDLLHNWIVNGGNKFTQVFRSDEGLYLRSPKPFIPKPSEIIIPKPIVNDLSVINHSLLEQVSKTPSMIYQCSPRQFEELVCELFEKKGYKVHLTNQTKDGGKDIIIIDNSILGSFLIYVECKKYAPHRPVGLNFVREFYGTINADRATAGLIITSSYFSKPAKEFVESKKHQMSLMDYVQLISEIQKLSKTNAMMKWPS